MPQIQNVLITLFAAALVLLAPQAAPCQTKAIVGANVVDLDGGPAIRDGVVVIEGERISAVGPAGSTPVPTGAEVIHADGMWLTPGLMNMHVHFALILPGKMQAELANEKETEKALRVAHNARLSLLSGVTTIRAPGDKRETAIALDKAIKKGQAVGPRIFSAGESVPITAGHGSRNVRRTYDGARRAHQGGPRTG